MKLATVENGIVSGGVVETNAFTIKATGKAFAILSSGLYTNKIQAIIRELSCNAFDAHVANGNPQDRFTVKMPNRLDLTFAVRDYGIGLPHEKVMTLYTTYFESTKTDSNDFIGALGLGSKSPFSYTKSFTVESFYNGVHRIYNAHIAANGMPDIALLSEVETSEPNGLRVSFPVKDNDISSFIREAEVVFRYFRVRPEIVGTELNIAPVEYFKESEAGRWAFRNANHDHYYQKNIPRAIMGNVSYPLTTSGLPLDEYGTSDENERVRRKKAAKILNSPFDLFFNIGELDITASREALSYDEPTIEAIINRAVAVFDEIVTATAAEINAIDNLWDATIALTELSVYNSNSTAYIRFLREITEVLKSLGDDYCGLTFMKWRGQKLDAIQNVNGSHFHSGFSFRVIQSKTSRYGHFRDFIMKKGADSIIGRYSQTGAFGNGLNMAVNPSETKAVYINDQGLAGLHRIRRSFTDKHRSMNSSEYAIILTFEPALERAMKHRIETDQTAFGEFAKKVLASMNFPAGREIYASDIELPKHVEEQIRAEVAPKVRAPYIRVKTSGLFVFSPFTNDNGELSKRLSWDEVESLEDQQKFASEGGFFVYLDGHEAHLTVERDKNTKSVTMSNMVSPYQLRALQNLLVLMGVMNRGDKIYGVRRSFMKSVGSIPTPLTKAGPMVTKNFNRYVADFKAVSALGDVHNAMDKASSNVYNLLTDTKVEAKLKKEVKVGDIADAYQQLRDYNNFRARAEGRLSKLPLNSHDISTITSQLSIANSTLGVEVDWEEATANYKAVVNGVVDKLSGIAKKYPLMLMRECNLNDQLIGHVVQYVKMIDASPTKTA